MALASASEVDCGCCGGADGWPLEDVVWVGGCGTGSEVRCDSAWRERSCATRSEESLAALTARVVGIVRRAEAKAAMASCSLEPCEVFVRIYYD
jgi:hypothetical protein